MISVLAAIRSMILGGLSDWDLGLFARQHIQNRILPELRRVADKIEDELQKKKIEEVAEFYEGYLDRSNPKSKHFGEKIREIIRYNLKKQGLDEGEGEDFEQTLMLSFLQPRSESGKTLLNVLEKFDHITSPPIKFMNFWWMIINKMMMTEVRNRVNSSPETVPRNRDDVLDTRKAPAEIVWDNDIVSDLSKYVHSKMKNPKYAEMFNIWIDIVQRNDRKVNMNQDVYPLLRARGYVGTDGVMADQWKNIVLPLIRDFFDEEFGPEHSNLIRRFFGSVVEIVSYNEYRRRMAGWVLGLG